MAALPAFARGGPGQPPLPRTAPRSSAPPPHGPVLEAVRPNNFAVSPQTKGPVYGPNVHPTPDVSPRSVQNQVHLVQWMERHSNLSLPEQQDALQNEPGFRELPRQVQQYELSELAHLYSMDPHVRTRILEHNEALEPLSAAQQKQWRIAVQDLSSIPSPRRHLLLHAIMDLRELPIEQRQQVLNSPGFSAHFSDAERKIIGTILTAEPYSPHLAL